MTIAHVNQTAALPPQGAALARRLRDVRRKRQITALLLVAPLMLLLLAIFVLPIGALLTRAVDNSAGGAHVAGDGDCARRMEW